VANKIDKEVRAIIDTAYTKAKELLTKNKRKLRKIAKNLIERETLEGADLDMLLSGAKLASKTK